METVLLSRLQFAWTIGLPHPVACLHHRQFRLHRLVNALWLATSKPVYRDLLRFWIHLFALGSP